MVVSGVVMTEVRFVVVLSGVVPIEVRFMLS